jgi:PAS domain S-box-containing protein
MGAEGMRPPAGDFGAGSSRGYTPPARWEWNETTGRAVLSPLWEVLLGLPAGSAAAGLQCLYDQMHEGDLLLFREALDAVLSGREAGLDLAVRMKRRDNAWTWILFRGERPDPEREPGRVEGTALEISRLRLDGRFFPSTREDGPSSYQSLLDNSPHFILRYDRELFPLYINPAMERLIGCKLEELGNKQPMELGTDPEDLIFLHECVLAAFATGERRKTRRTVLTRPGPMEGEFQFWPEFGEDGETVRTVLVHIQDLTSQARQEQMLRLNEMRASALYNLTQMHDATEEELMAFVALHVALLTGSEYGHLYIPQSTVHAGGYTLWEVDARVPRSPGTSSVWRQSHPGGLARDYGRKPCIQNNPKDFPPRYFLGDKNSVTRYMFAPAMEKGVVACVAAVYNKETDYVEEDLLQLERFINGAWPVLRHQAYVEALEKAKESAVRANAVKDRFLANVSHELRTPLNGLLGMLQIIASSDLTPELREYVHNADLTGRTLLRIISDILDFSRMQAGALTLDIAPFDVRQTLTSTLEIFRDAAEKKGLSLECALEGDFPPFLRGDEARIRQILFNLLGNSLKFTLRGSILLRGTLLPAAQGENPRLILSVSDTGIGIPQAMQAAVFDAFTQIQSKDIRKLQGTGLGLGIVRQLAEQMGGSVSLESLPGQGTTVRCTLSLEAMPDGEAPSPPGEESPRAEEEEDPLPPLTVLVAEDDRVSRIAMRLFLQRQGHSVFCVENGRQALEALLLYPFDCLISDVLMPEMDGLELTRRIRQGLWDDISPGSALREALPGDLPARGGPPGSIPADLPIVSASAHAMHGDREHFLQAGMDFYLAKPLNAAELARVLALVAAKRAACQRSIPSPGQK